MEFYERTKDYLGSRLLEIGCGGGFVAKYICEQIHPERYVGFEVRDRLDNEIRANMPENFEYVLTKSHDVRYNGGGSGIVVPDGEFDTVLGKSWMTHVTLEVLQSYSKVFAERLLSGGHMIQTCFVSEERAGEIDGKCLHTFYSREMLETMSDDFELIEVDFGGWPGGEVWAPHDIVIWRRK